ncbi:DUF7344 domain-containing protein [Halosimplex salinum]|uniref:DUF7344 domain-containing protein n=1 Tax=Halosimplex salinum TaxID=1710538 RepID=UPI000F4A9CB6|nr:hypothetical protein [Halosimplex salinum]
MNSMGETPTARLSSQSIDVLTDARRRDVLASLANVSGSVTERELATELAAAERNTTAASVSSEEVRAIRSELYHAHLPALEDAGLVSWEQTDETVAPTDHPLFDDARFDSLVRADGDWDGVSSCLTGDRRAVLAVLESSSGRVERDALARELVAREASGAPSTEAVDTTEVRLHHVHLPKLDEAGLVDYDVDDGTVAYRGEAALRGERLQVGR